VVRSRAQSGHERDKPRRDQLSRMGISHGRKFRLRYRVPMQLAYANFRPARPHSYRHLQEAGSRTKFLPGRTTRSSMVKFFNRALNQSFDGFHRGTKGKQLFYQLHAAPKKKSAAIYSRIQRQAMVIVPLRSCETKTPVYTCRRFLNLSGSKNRPFFVVRNEGCCPTEYSKIPVRDQSDNPHELAERSA